MSKLLRHSFSSSNAEIEAFIGQLFAQLPLNEIARGPTFESTETLIFEFAGGADLAIAMSRDGSVVAVFCSAAAVQVSVNTDKLTQSPNGGQTRLVTGFVWNNGLIGTSGGNFQCHAPFKTGDFLKVSVTAATVVCVVVGYSNAHVGIATS